jgi:hypothetical protein
MEGGESFMIDKESLLELFEQINGVKPPKKVVKSVNKSYKDKRKQLYEEKSLEAANIVRKTKLNSYYINKDNQKVSVRVNIEYTNHAYNRIALRELNHLELESAIKRGIGKLFRLGEGLERDFQIYSKRYFTVIPGAVYFDRDRRLMRIMIKTAFASPTPNFKNHEKLIYV